MKNVTLLTVLLITLIIAGVYSCKKDDSSSSTASTSSTSSTASTSSTSSTSSISSTSSTSGGNTITLSGSSLHITSVMCGNYSSGKKYLGVLSDSGYCSVDFSVDDPPSGIYTTTDANTDSSSVSNVVRITGSGSSYGETLVSANGSSVTVAKNGSSYTVQFTNVAIHNASGSNTKYLSGKFTCN